MRMFRGLVLAAAMLTAFSAGQADAAELKVLCAGAMRSALQELARGFEAVSGHKVVLEFATAGKVEERVAAGEDVDVAILTQPRINKLMREGRVVGGTIVPLARVQIGLAVKKGAPKPDISSVEAFKQTLLTAKSVAYIDPASGGTSGIHLAQVLDKLGIAAELKPRLRLVMPPAGQQSARVGEVVARGEAEIGMQPVSELMEVPEVDVVGPLPAQLQSPDLSFFAGSTFLSEHAIAAKALIDFLNGPKAVEVYKAKGLLPG